MGNWKSAGSSKHPFYVTREKPKPFDVDRLCGENQPRALTSIDLGCRGYLSDPTLLVKSIFTKFNTRSISPVGSNEIMSYWGPESGIWLGQIGNPDFIYCRELWHLFSKKDARCGEWKLFLGDVLSIQGFSETSMPPSRINSVNLFAYNQAKQYLDPTTNLFNAVKSKFPNFDETNPYDPINNSVYIVSNGTKPRGVFFVNKWAFVSENEIYDASSDLNGIPSQGNTDPQPWFSDHTFLKHNNEYYDPSYGTIAASLTEYAINSVAGVGVIIKEKILLNNTIEYYWLDKKINSSNALNLLNFQEQ